VCAESKGFGYGATFTIAFPLLSRPSQASEQQISWSQTKGPLLEGLHVWVVDDDEQSRKMLKMILERKGALVTTVAAARETLSMLDKSMPEVLVCDVSMPEMDGYTLMHQIRARDAEHGGNVPAIAQTGYATAEDRERALSSGYQVFLGKPLDLDELVRSIARLAGSHT